MWTWPRVPGIWSFTRLAFSVLLCYVSIFSQILFFTLSWVSFLSNSLFSQRNSLSKYSFSPKISLFSKCIDLLSHFFEFLSPSLHFFLSLFLSLSHFKFLKFPQIPRISSEKKFSHKKLLRKLLNNHRIYLLKQ